MKRLKNMRSSVTPQVLRPRDDGEPEELRSIYTLTTYCITQYEPSAVERGRGSGLSFGSMKKALF